MSFYETKLGRSVIAGTLVAAVGASVVAMLTHHDRAIDGHAALPSNTVPGRELECHLDDSASIVLENGQAFNFTAPYLVPNTGNEGVDAMDVYVEDKNGKALVSARPHQFEGGPAEYEPIPGVVFVSPNNMPAGDTPELRVSIEAAGAGKLAVDAACVVG